MAKFDINSYARRGAESRIAELTEELESIYTAFPDLRSGRRGRRRGARTQGAATSSADGGAPAVARVRRKRRAMTAAQKKAVSARMKRYWAERRKGDK